MDRWDKPTRGDLRRRLLALLALLLCALLLATPALLLGATRSDDLAINLPWSGGVYTFGLEPCGKDQSAALVVRRRPAYYQLARGSDLLRLPVAPRCP